MNGSAEQPARSLGHLNIKIELCAEEVTENDWGQRPPPQGQVLERRILADSRTRLERTVLSRLIEPKA
ncbi:hypothetical protein [Thalassococcus sp. S3]|uniref:hypothetical protein n=1 Tax=Thalassococcus sp. S3 TaxID=2017482 RepID=UPI0020C2016F|nr:hypothetical protein [Thalassococcus sp. S3]